MAQLTDGNSEVLILKCLKVNLSVVEGSDPKGESVKNI